MGRNDQQHALRFALWYGPLYIGIILLFIANIFIFCRVKKSTSEFTGTFNPEMEAQKKFLQDKVRSLKL
jgi:predicted metal-dependent peptidase